MCVISFMLQVVEESSKKLVRSGKAKDLTKTLVKMEVKQQLKDAFKMALAQHACTTAINTAFSEHATDMDWMNDPSYPFGNGEGIVGNLETLDITGVVALVGIFHEADCPAQLAESAYNGEYGDSCPR